MSVINDVTARLKRQCSTEESINEAANKRMRYNELNWRPQIQPTINRRRGSRRQRLNRNSQIDNDDSIADDYRNSEQFDQQFNVTGVTIDSSSNDESVDETSTLLKRKLETEADRNDAKRQKTSNEEEEERLCCICWEKLSSNKKSVYALMESCDHVFCYECLKTWRKGDGFTPDFLRRCPICRKQSWYNVPSKKYLSGFEKDRYMINYLISNPDRNIFYPFLLWERTGILQQL